MPKQQHNVNANTSTVLPSGAPQQTPNIEKQEIGGTPGGQQQEQSWEAPAEGGSYTGGVEQVQSVVEPAEQNINDPNLVKAAAPEQSDNQREPVPAPDEDNARIPAVDAASVAAQTAGLAPKVGTEQGPASPVSDSDEGSSGDILANVELPAARGANFIQANAGWSREERPSAVDRQPKPRQRRELQPKTSTEPAEGKREAAEPTAEEERNPFDDSPGDAPKSLREAMDTVEKRFAPIKKKADEVVSGMKNLRTSASRERLYKRTAKISVGHKDYAVGAIYAKITGDARYELDEIAVGMEDLKEAFSIPNSGIRSYLLDHFEIVLPEDAAEAARQLKTTCETTGIPVGVFKSPNLEPESSCRMFLRVCNGRGLRMHPLALKRFNADTDGDDACVSFYWKAVKRCVDALDYLVNLAGDLTLDPDFMPFYIRRAGVEPSQQTVDNALRYIRKSITKDEHLAEVILDMYFAKPDDMEKGAREEAVRRFAQESFSAYKGRRAYAKFLGRTYTQLRRLCIAQFGYGRQHLTNEELMQNLPEAVTDNDRNLYRFTEALLDEATVRSSGVANFQDLRVMMRDYQGEPGGTNPSFRFTANIAKMFVNVDDRMVIGSDNKTAVEGDKEIEIPMTEMLNGLLKYVESAKISDSLDAHERGKQAKETLCESVRSKVGILPDATPEGNAAFLRKFIKVYRQEAELIHAANFELSTEYNIEYDSSSSEMNTIGDLARCLRDVYGDVLTMSQLVRVRKDLYKNRQAFQFAQVKHLVDTYGSWTVNRFAKENKYWEQGVNEKFLKTNAEKPIGKMSADPYEATWELVYAFVNMRSSTGSEFNKKVYENGDSVCAKMYKILQNIKQEDPGYAEWHAQIQNAVELLNASDPDVFAYFGMDNIQGFLGSGYGQAMLDANVEGLKSIRIAMTTEYRMHRIHELEEAYAREEENVEAVYDELMYEEDLLASSSWVWAAVIKDKEQAAIGDELRPFAMFKQGDFGWLYMSKNENGKEKRGGAYFKMYSTLQKHSTLEDVLLDIDLSKEDKCAIVADVTRYYQQFRWISSYTVPEMLEHNPYPSYSMLKSTSEGVMSATKEFNKLYDKQEKSREDILDELQEADKIYRNKPGALDSLLNFYVDSPGVYCPVRVEDVANAMCSVLDKAYAQSEKSKQHLWTNVLYAALSFTRNGGFFSDVYRTDNRALGLQSIDMLSPYDFVCVLSGKKELYVYDDNGGVIHLTRDTLVGRENATENDIWEFLWDNPNIAAVLRRHCVGRMPKGGYLGSCSTISESFRLLDVGGLETNDQFARMADDPRFAALVAFITPTRHTMARDMRPRYMENIINVLNILGRCDGDVERAMVELGATEDVLRELGLSDEAIYTTAEGGKGLLDNIRESIRDWYDEFGAEAFKPFIEAFSSKTPLGPDLASCYAYYDVRQEFSGAKTAVSTGVEGSETHKLAMFISSLGLTDKYASLDEFVDLGEVDMETLLEYFNGCENSLGKPFSAFTDEDWKNGDVIVSLPEGVVRGDKAINEDERMQTPSVCSYLIVKRDFGAEKFNLKAKKTGDDGRHSVTKHGKYYTDKELAELSKASGSPETSDYGELSGWLQAIYEGSENGLFQAKLALARRLLEANRIGGYDEMTLADCMNLADLMIVVDEDGFRVRSIELIAKAIRANLTFDLVRHGTKDEISAVAREAAARAGAESFDIEAVLASIRIRPKANGSGPTRPRSSSLALNLNAMRSFRENNPGLQIADPKKKKVIGLKEKTPSWVKLVMDKLGLGYVLMSVREPPKAIGPSAVWAKEGMFSPSDLEIIRRQGITGVCTGYIEEGIPFKIAAEIFYIVPGFDMAVNGESNQFAGTFGVFHRPADNVVYTYEDDLNEFNLGDAGFQPFKALVERLRVNWKETTQMTTSNLFPNVFKAYPDASFSCHLAEKEEIAAILSKGSNVIMDVGVTPGTKGFDRHWKMTMDAVDRYCDEYDSNREKGFVSGGIRKEAAPGDVVGFMTMIVTPLGEKPFRVYAPIIPFDLTGRNEVSREAVPSHFEVKSISYKDEKVPAESFLALDWEYDDDVTKHSVKFFEGQSTANKFFTSLENAVEWFKFKGTDIDIDGCYAPESTASRRIGSNKRLGTMQTLMYVARTRGYNYAEHIPGNPMFINAQGEEEPLKERLANRYLTKSEWASIGIHSNASAKSVFIDFSDDPELNIWIKQQLCLYARNGGNPTDFLACRFGEDDKRTDIWWEFECMFGTKPQYQDGLLKFLNKMDDELCPDSVRSEDETKVFRVNQKDQCMQMQVPHKNPMAGKYFYSWVNVYAGWSFFNFNDFTGAHRPNINGFSDTLDAIATHQLAGRTAADREYRIMLERSMSDLGEVKSKFGVDVVRLGKVLPGAAAASEAQQAEGTTLDRSEANAGPQ